MYYIPYYIYYVLFFKISNIVQTNFLTSCAQRKFSDSDLID